MWHQIQLIGNLGNNPELRYLPTGTPVCSFSVAVNKEYTASSGEHVKQTIWVRVSAFGKLGEICNQYLSKGSKAFIGGELQPDKSTGGPRVYESNGIHKASFEITANTVRFLSRKSGDMTDQSQELGGVPVDEDVPF